jgi:hypothetical protein
VTATAIHEYHQFQHSFNLGFERLRDTGAVLANGKENLPPSTEGRDHGEGQSLEKGTPN